jgi:hypothetical protein
MSEGAGSQSQSSAENQGEDPCTICFEDLTSQKCKLESCTHAFHFTCIKAYYEISKSKWHCPLCRRRFTKVFVEGVGWIPCSVVVHDDSDGAYNSEYVELDLGALNPPLDAIGRDRQILPKADKVIERIIRTFKNSEERIGYVETVARIVLAADENYIDGLVRAQFFTHVRGWFDLSLSERDNPYTTERERRFRSVLLHIVNSIKSHATLDVLKTSRINKAMLRCATEETNAFNRGLGLQIFTSFCDSLAPSLPSALGSLASASSVASAVPAKRPKVRKATSNNAQYT